MKTAITPPWKSLLIIVVLLLSNLLAHPYPVHAATPILVTTGVDELNTTSNGKCSLREAVISANEARAVGGCTSGAVGADEIFLPANLPDGEGNQHEYFLKLDAPGEDAARTGDLDILDTLTIRGAGPTFTIIQSSGSDRVFDILSLGSKLVTIEGIAIIGGSDVLSGGGIFNYASTLVLRNVYITGNHANSLGGGVINKIQLVQGGQIGSSIKIYNSVIANNTTTGDGGGIYNDGDLEISNSLIATNTAALNGGGISNNVQSGYAVVITNTTITKNIGVNGAGIFTAGNSFTLKNSTIYDNNGTTFVTDVAGLKVYQLGKVTLKNTIIAGHASPRVNCDLLTGAEVAEVTSNGHNLEDTNTCGLNPAGQPEDDLVNTPAGLDSFGAYGSGTLLYGLVTGSAAIDTGAIIDCPSTDQRGVNFGRPADGNGDTIADCDIGAYEVDALPSKLTYTYLPAIIR